MACGSRRPAGGGLRCGHGCLQWGGGGGGLWRRGLEVHLCTLGRGRGGGATAALPPDMLALPLRTERAPPCRDGGVVRTARRRGCGSTRRVRGCSREGASPSPPGAAVVQKRRVSGTNTSGAHRRGGSQPDPEDTDRQTHHPDSKERHTGHAPTPARTTKEKHPHMRGARLVGSDTQTGGDERGSCGGGGSGNGALRFLSAQRGALCRPGCGRQGGA